MTAYHSCAYRDEEGGCTVPGKCACILYFDRNHKRITNDLGWIMYQYSMGMTKPLGDH